MSLIFIPFVYGYIEEGHPIGWTAVFCDYCRSAQPAVCFDMTKQNTIYGLNVTRARPISKKVVCSFCNESRDVIPNALLPIDRYWSPENGFQRLVDTTNPALGQIRERRTRSADEVKAILRRIEEWADYSFHNEGYVTSLFAVIAIVSFIVGCIIGSYLPLMENGQSYMMFCGVGLPVLTCLVSYFIVKFYAVRKNLHRRLVQAGSEKGISRQEFIRALSKMPDRKKVLTWAVSNL